MQLYGNGKKGKSSIVYCKYLVTDLGGIWIIDPDGGNIIG